MSRSWPCAVALLLVSVGGLGCARSDDDATASQLASRDDQGDRAAYDHWRQPARLVAELELAPGDRVADIGAGRGYLEPYLANAIGPDGRIVATDVDGAALAALAAAPHSAVPPIETRKVTPSDPGLEAATYDLVLLAMVDHLLPDRAAYFRKLIPALASDGRIAISNRIDREAGARAAAESAGLEVVRASHDLPGQFLLLLSPRVTRGDQ